MEKERRNSDEDIQVAPPEGGGAGRKKTLRMIKYVMVSVQVINLNFKGKRRSK